MIRTVKLDEVSFSEPKFNKNGGQYVMCFIKVKDKSASCYLDVNRDTRRIEEMKEWVPGMEVTLNFEQKGKYTNFNLPTATQRLEQRVAALEAVVFATAPEPVKEVETSEDVNPEDLPF